MRAEFYFTLLFSYITFFIYTPTTLQRYIQVVIPGDIAPILSHFLNECLSLWHPHELHFDLTSGAIPKEKICTARFPAPAPAPPKHLQ